MSMPYISMNEPTIEIVMQCFMNEPPHTKKKLIYLNNCDFQCYFFNSHFRRNQNLRKQMMKLLDGRTLFVEGPEGRRKKNI